MARRLSPPGPSALLPTTMPIPPLRLTSPRPASKPAPRPELGDGIGVVDDRLGVVDGSPFERPDLPGLVDGRSVDRRKLRHVAPDIVPGGIEALGLPDRVEHPVRPG